MLINKREWKGVNIHGRTWKHRKGIWDSSLELWDKESFLKLWGMDSGL
jgi:hypothetical protein